jgi:acetoacetyl-CoA reductase
MRTVDNAVAVVTGAGRGIGRAIAEELGSGGAIVVVNYSKSKGPAEELVESLLKNGAKGAVAIQADVSDPDQATQLIEETIKRFGRIDLLVNNAGINIDRSLKNMSVQDWRTVIETDLSSFFYTIKAALNYFMQQKSGAIINMSSLAGQIGNFGQANYAAAKAGILGLTRTAAIELARYNVSVQAISPGPVETEMWDAVPKEGKEAIIKRIPAGRPAHIKEIARAVRYLYEDGEYLTGTVLDINGGWYSA